MYLRIALQDKCLLKGKIRSTVVQEWVEEKLSLVKDLMISIVTILLYLTHKQIHMSCVCRDFLLNKSCPGLASLDQRPEING